jgi:hypothetical protein
MGSRPERGAYGNARGKKPKNARRAARLSQPRVAAALEAARAHEAMIDEAIAAGNVGSGRPVLVYSGPPVDPAAVLEAMQDSRPMILPDAPMTVTLKIDWCIKDVYHMLHQGYRTTYVSKRTGYDHDIVCDLWNDLYVEEEEVSDDHGLT